MSRIWILSLPLWLVLLAFGPSVMAQPAPWTPDREPWTTQDVIDERIDVHAQYALMRMLKGDAFERFDASAMLSAVKSGELAGIYIVDQRVAALRAQEVGKSWWTILPSGVDAICITQPASKPPLIAFSKKAQKDQHVLDPALRGAWASCGLEPAPVRPYVTNLPPKQPRETRPCATVPGGKPSLSVKVVDSITYDEYAGASVTVSSAGASQCQQLETVVADAEANASFDLGCAGNYIIVASTEAGYEGMQLVKAAGECAYSILLAVRPPLEESEECDWPVFYSLLEECDKQAIANFERCGADEDQTKLMRDSDDTLTFCVEVLRRDKVNCNDMARRGANCE